jgi:hypothetical protein
MHNPYILEKLSKKCYSSKKYILPSGKIINVQGYEHFALNELLKIFNENDIISGSLNVPNIYYKDINNKIHKHYVDFYIPIINKCIEVKSIWTLEKKYDNVYIKQEAAKKLGYLYEIWVYDPLGVKINIII